MVGRYHIQVLMPGDRWVTDISLRDMGKEFSRGAFAALRTLSGGGLTYRLIHRDREGTITELERHGTGQVRVNTQDVGSDPDGQGKDCNS